MSKILRITAKRDGYRRCGVGHPGEAVDHALDVFNAKQIEILKADSMLVVQEMDADAAADAAGAKDDVARLRAEAEADRKAAAEDRKKAAEELKAAAEDRKKAADELTAAEKVRKDAEAAAAAKGEKPSAKGGKKN